MAGYRVANKVTRASIFLPAGNSSFGNANRYLGLPVRPVMK